LNKNNIHIFPSIVNSSFSVESTSKSIFPLQINMYNSLGVLCKYFFIEDNRLLNISDLSQGVYFLQIKAKNKTYRTQKFIKT